MALIECTECGHKVSDKAECCPNCGCPIEEIMSADASNNTNVSQVYDDAVQFDDIPPKKSKGWLWTIVVILVLAAIDVGVWLFTNGKLGEDDPTTAKVEITPEFIAAVHQYDELYPFSEGLAAVKKDGKFGYIDTKGNLVIPCQFGYASDFIEGTAVVAKDDGMPYCILNRDGRVVETKYILKDNSRYIESDGSLSQSSETHILNGEVREYVGFYTLTEKKDNGDNVAHYLDKNLKEVTEPSESLLRDFAPDSVYTEYFESGKDYLGNDENLSGLKDKKGTIIIPARYKYVRMCDNCVALAEIRVEPADFHQEGLTVFGYIDLNGNSTFTDADFKKIEAYKQEQLAKKEELDRQAAEEEQARLEEERRQEELQQHPEIKFNEMLADNAWHAYGTWHGTPMEYIVTFRPKNKYAGRATFVRWINNGRRNEYSLRGTSDCYQYIIKGNILEMEWDSYWDGHLKYQFAIEYSNGEIILVDTNFSNRKYRPISKTRELIPSEYQL